MDLLLLLDEMNRGVSDLHLVAGKPPIFRKDGKLMEYEGPVLNKATILDQLVLPHLSERNRHLIQDGGSVLATVQHRGKRYRMHAFRERGGVSATIRLVPGKVPTLQDLDVSDSVKSLLQKITHITRGLILVTGPTGSGKTTILAALLEEINHMRSERIVTLENPIEYLFESKKSLITQQELGTDFFDLPTALREVVYTDANIIYLSELKSLEAVHLALSLAEAGHLVLASLGSHNIFEALTRLVEAFPESMRGEIRRQLASNVQAVIAQILVPRLEKPGRIPLQEIMIATPYIRQRIREGNMDLTEELEQGQVFGARTMDYSLLKALKAREISRETAQRYITNHARLKEVLKTMEEDSA